MRNEVYFGVGTKAITSIPKLSCRTPMDAAIASDIILPYSQNTVCMDELCVMKVLLSVSSAKTGMYTTANYNIPMLPLPVHREVVCCWCEYRLKNTFHRIMHSQYNSILNKRMQSI